MKLTCDQVQSLGADDKHMKKAGCKKTRIYPESKDGLIVSFFDCVSCTYEFVGYRRYVGWSCTQIDEEPKPQTVRKLEDGNGFFPTIASHGVRMNFDVITSRIENQIKQLQKLVPGLQVKWITPKVCQLEFPHQEKSIYEFDFCSHNFGFCLSKLEKNPNESEA
jgi:hypothetical protein